MDYLSNQILLYTSEKYEEIYKEINSRFKITYAQLFTLMVAIGFKNNKKVPLLKYGREFRSTYLKEDSRTIIYTILLSDKSLNIEFKDLIDNKKFKEYSKVLQEYAEGGMSFLIENIFPENIEKNTNSKNYDDYIFEIAKYVHTSCQKAPF